MRTFARAIQVIGLVIPVAGFLLSLDTVGGISMTYSFGGLGLGAGIFYLGWLLQQNVEA
ncbi:MAG: hypothetical protein AAGD14_02670 [Planctomycetota bacterium]